MHGRRFPRRPFTPAARAHADWVRTTPESPVERAAVMFGRHGKTWPTLARLSPLLDQEPDRS